VEDHASEVIIRMLFCCSIYVTGSKANPCIEGMLVEAVPRALKQGAMEGLVVHLCSLRAFRTCHMLCTIVMAYSDSDLPENEAYSCAATGP
jgi:hypothetical protein